MTEDVEQPESEYLIPKEISQGAAILVGMQNIKGKEARELSHTACGDLLKAHILVTGALGSCLLRMNGLRARVTPQSLDRDAVLAAFIVGLSVCDDAILEARYVQSAALLRQELEMLALLKTLQEGVPPKGKAPNIRHLSPDLKRIYSSLTEMTHLTDRDLLGDLHSIVEETETPGDTRFTRQFPVADGRTARRLITLQTLVMVQAIEEISVDMARLGLSLTEPEIVACNKAMEIMVEQGMAESD